VRRKLEITIDARWLRSDKHYFPLPDGWDEMTQDERQRTIDDYAESVISNRVSITGQVVEVMER